MDFFRPCVEGLGQVELVALNFWREVTFQFYLVQWVLQSNKVTLSTTQQIKDILGFTK